MRLGGSKINGGQDSGPRQFMKDGGRGRSVSGRRLKKLTDLPILILSAR